MKILLMGLSVLAGLLTGLLYDLQIPMLAIGAVKFSGPALAATLSVMTIMASGLLGISMILERMERLSSRDRGTWALAHQSNGPRFGMLDGGKSDHEASPITITATRRLPVIDLANLELRAER